jgi:hypothetical protein
MQLADLKWKPVEYDQGRIGECGLVASTARFQDARGKWWAVYHYLDGHGQYDGKYVFYDSGIPAALQTKNMLEPLPAQRKLDELLGLTGSNRTA